MIDYNGTPDRRERLLGNIERQKGIVEGSPLRAPTKRFYERMAEVSTAKYTGDYSKAYDLADQLLTDMNEHSVFYSDGEKSTVWARIFDMLEDQYGDAIIEKYNKCYEEILKFGSYETYRVSHYPGTYEEYARSAALDEIMSLYAKTRYGGYMHVIIMRVLEKHFEEEKTKRNERMIGKAKEMTKEPGLPQNITAEQKRQKIEQAKEAVRRACTKTDRSDF